jgi:hypothetical protein
VSELTVAKAHLSPDWVGLEELLLYYSAMLAPRARQANQEAEVVAQDLVVVEQLGSKPGVAEVVDIADAVVAFSAIVVEMKAQMTGHHSYI